MGKYRFADVDVIRIELPDGDWVDMRKEYTFEESRKIEVFTARDKLPEMLDIVITDWSLTDRDGVTKVPKTVDAIRNLSSLFAKELISAMAAKRDEIEKEKKAQKENHSSQETDSYSTAQSR